MKGATGSSLPTLENRQRKGSLEADVVIVGGGPAGLATALFLCHADPRRRGRVVVLEKESYPRDKFCAGGVGARADQLLARIGATVDVPSVPIDGMSLELAGGKLAAQSDAIGRVIRRLEYDHELARVTARRGVAIHEGARVSALRVGDHGVIVESTAGTWHAQAVVGADGVGSFVRRAIGLPTGKLRAQVVEVDTEQVRGDPERNMLHFDASDTSLTGYAWDFPTLVDGEPLVCRGVYELKVGEDHAAERDPRASAPRAPAPRDRDVQARLCERLAARGLDLGRYRVKRFAERGFERHMPYAAPRVMLVGEAAGIDGLTGEGIAQAVAYGAFAGPYLAEKLAARDLSFTDFASRLARSSVGFELRVRGRTLPYYFGRHRALIERFVLSTPDFFAMGLEHFAGRKLSRSRLARSALSFGIQLLSREQGRRSTRVGTQPEPV
jgi:flavin-dependent dehydrogenase